MPIEIKELIIRGTIIEHSLQEEAAPVKLPAAFSHKDKKKLVKECAELVIELLAKKNRR